MIDVITPSRLHFGLLAFDPAEPRQFGGVGLMVRQPMTRIRLSHADDVTAEGRMADRATDFASRFLEWAAERDPSLSESGVHIKIASVPRPHTGLGSGTQLGIAVATGLAKLFELGDLSITDRAAAVSRGKRSAIGAHGFIQGGLIVEGGKREPHELSPMISRSHFPDDWRVVLIRPHLFDGLSGEREQIAFDTKLNIPQAVTAELCRIVLLGMIPSLIEQDINTFGDALYDLQSKVGDCFAGAQGGRWADPQLGQIVQFVRDQGVRGVGQSSWGPTLYAVCEDDERAEDLASKLQATFELDPDEVRITEADNHGAVVRKVQQSAKR